MRPTSFKILPLVIGGILVVIALWLAVQREKHLPPGVSSYAEMQEATKKFASSFKNFESMEGPEMVQSASVIYDEDGKKLSLTDFKGKVVVLNLWATWCAPCVKELPLLAKLKDLRPDIEVIAVSLDLNKTPEELHDFLDKNEADTLQVHTGKGPEMDVQFPNRGLPTTYLVTSDGHITYRMEGDADWTSSNALIFIDFVKSQK